MQSRANALLARVGLLLAIICTVLHVVILLQAPDLGSWSMLAIAVACSVCMWHGRRAPDTDMWVWMCLGTLAMFVLHLSLHGGVHTHRPGPGSPALAAAHSWASQLALAVVCVELTVSVTALTLAGIRQRLARRRMVQRESA